MGMIATLVQLRHWDGARRQQQFRHWDGELIKLSDYYVNFEKLKDEIAI